MWYVYVLRSEKTGAFYKGSTNDLSRRIREHNAGYEKYTSAGRPWKLIWYTQKPTMSEARQLERKIKNITSRQRMLEFIDRHGGLGIAWVQQRDSKTKLLVTRISSQVLGRPLLVTL